MILLERLPELLFFTLQSQLLTTLKEKAFENIVGNAEYAGNFLPFSSNMKLPSANSFSLEESEIRHLGEAERVKD